MKKRAVPPRRLTSPIPIRGRPFAGRTRARSGRRCRGRRRGRRLALDVPVPDWPESAVVEADVEVEVDACAVDASEPGWLVLPPPADVEEDVDVDACAVDAPDFDSFAVVDDGAAWPQLVEDDGAVALDWVFVCVFELPDADGPAAGVEAVVVAQVVVLVCAFEFADPGWPAAVVAVGVAGADGVAGAHDGVVLVAEAGGVVGAHDVVVWAADGLPVDGFAVVGVATGDADDFEGDVLVVLPQLWDPETSAEGIVADGVEVADVFDELCVLDAPPLIVGWTLIMGRTVIV